MSFDIDASVADSSAAINAAAEQDKIEAIQNGDKIGATKGDDMPVKDWMSNLPKNVGVGIMDAAVNTVDAAKSFAGATYNYWSGPNSLQKTVNEEQGLSPDGQTMQQLRLKALASGARTLPDVMTPDVAERYSPSEIYDRNKGFAQPAPAGGYGTKLNPEEETAFQDWAKKNNVPFDNSPTSDYDMRGFYKGLTTGDPNAQSGVNQNDGKLHYSDYWKTPFHHSFSAESQFANPATAPKWNAQDQLVDPSGKVVFDERATSQDNPMNIHSDFRSQFMALRNELASGSTTSDEITQGIAQFAVPMLGWSKLLGVTKAISASGFLAEGITASSALAPHAGRNADLVQQGKAIEGKLGDALNTIAPDGSALNAYINYMTDRTGESDAEGRFKNVIDSMVTTTAGAALLKTGATALKVGMNLPGYIADTAGTGPLAGSPDAQSGKIVFHGTPHDFDTFSNDKIGTGEGNQSYGHGLYFAESPGVAGSYRSALSRRGVQPGSAMDNALSAVQVAGGNEQEAYKKLTAVAASTTSDEYRGVLTKAAGIVKAGNAKQRGAFMHVDVPDEHIDQMLDWDKPLSEQPQQVKDALGKSPWAVRDAAMVLTGDADPQGKDLYRSLTAMMGGSAKDASEHLNTLGVPGVRYLDGNSRSAGAGTRNIVLFDAKHAKIVKKE